jgi:hypothetical protein
MIAGNDLRSIRTSELVLVVEEAEHCLLTPKNIVYLLRLVRGLVLEKSNIIKSCIRLLWVHVIVSGRPVCRMLVVKNQCTKPNFITQPTNQCITIAKIFIYSYSDL